MVVDMATSVSAFLGPFDGANSTASIIDLRISAFPRSVVIDPSRLGPFLSNMLAVSSYFYIRISKTPITRLVTRTKRLSHHRTFVFLRP